MTLTIAVVGAGVASPELAALAEEVGREIARHGADLVCGGLGGVMEAAARGAREAGGRTFGILPGTERAAANPWIEVAVATGLGHARNAVVVTTADVVIALAGEGGTLSEVGLARALGRPVIGLGAWHDIVGVHPATTAAEAVDLALRLARNR